MKVIAEKIISILKGDPTLSLLMKGSSHIGSEAIQDKGGDIRILVSTNAGSDMNYIPADTGEIDIYISVNRSIEQAATTCYNISKRVDALLNRCETAISDDDFVVLNFVRSSSSGLQVLDYQQELFYSLSYSYILENDF